MRTGLSGMAGNVAIAPPYPRHSLAFIEGNFKIGIIFDLTFILCVMSSYFPIGAVWAVGASRCISLPGNPLIISTRPTIVTGKSIISLRNSHP